MEHESAHDESVRCFLHNFRTSAPLFHAAQPDPSSHRPFVFAKDGWHTPWDTVLSEKKHVNVKADTSRLEKWPKCEYSQAYLRATTVHPLAGASTTFRAHTRHPPDRTFNRAEERLTTARQYVDNGEAIQGKWK